MYLRGEDGRCTQRRASDLTFANAGRLVHWKSIRIGDPNDSRLWQVRPDEDPFLSRARDEHQLKMKVLKLKEWKLMHQCDNMGIGLPPAYVNEEEDS